ncbi:MAG TPA: SH3 domain-containing protein [Candidatus Sulfomarinibacteraceae bacterium]|nr:SH3 domain-containing protein [Candidatus Sulfomarinibacteraceae bacterium]
MNIVRARVPARRTRELLASAFGAVLLLLALTLPALGAPIGPTKLESPIVEPRAADTGTPITFTVTYRNAHALPPEYVRVAVAGATYSMSGAGSDWKAGVVFTVSTALPAGTHAVRFEARDAERFVDALESGSVVVGPAPTPTPPPPTPIPPPPTPTPPPPTPTSPPPSPTPPPAPAPTAPPSPTAAPQPTPPPTQPSTPAPTPIGDDAGSGTLVGPGSIGGTGAGGTGAGGTGAGGPTSGSGGPGDATGSGSGTWTGPASGAGTGAWIEGSGGWTPDRDGASAGSGTSTSGSGSPPSGTGEGPLLPWFAAAGDPSTTGDPAVGRDNGSISDRGPVDANGWLTGPFDAGLSALGVPTGGRLPTIPVAVGSSAVVATWMAFALFSKRRRDAEPIAPDDVLQASASTGYAIASVPLPVAPIDPEASMPRWRRPSLLEARRTDPIRSPVAPRPRLAFGSGPGEQASRAERRVIRYAFSPLLDRPDEIRSERIGELASGDEVEVRERSGAYLLVLCPDGRQGWVHRTTVGAPAQGSSAADWAGDSAMEPEAENALAALLAARGMR